MSPHTIVHEYDDEGRHRLKIMLAFQGMKSHAVGTHGDWEDYKVPAKVEYEGRTFIAFTNYWRGFFEADKIMELKEKYEL